MKPTRQVLLSITCAGKVPILLTDRFVPYLAFAAASHSFRLGAVGDLFDHAACHYLLCLVGHVYINV